MEATTAEGTAQRVSDAMLARDFDALRDELAPDVVLNSPITSSFRFQGPDEIVELLRIVRDSYEELEYTDVFGTGDTWAQVFRVRIRGQEMEATDLMRLDGEGRVREFTVFFRPLPGLAALTAALAPPLAEKRGGKSRAAAARVLTAPLVGLTRAGDRVAARLVRRR
jgi:SnoaL-like domain